ncbi:MAG: hypothetical protein KF830_12435 [Planctomycetes bacterium]|nr:hypothetical protein [Planctomycetota bacterium]
MLWATGSRVAWCVPLAFGVCEAARAQQYTIRHLTVPGLAHGRAYDVDNSMRVVGEAYASGLPQPVVWVNGIGVQLSAHPGGAEGSARRIDDTGRIGGMAATGSTSTMATTWEQHGSWTEYEMGLLPGTIFSGVNGLEGVVAAAGFADDGLFTYPIAWTSDADVGSPLPLPTLPALWQGEGLDITTGDVVVGYLANLVTAQPVSWSRTGGTWALTQLPTLGGWGIVTTAISPTFFLGASISPASGRIHFASWVNGAVADLGALAGTDCYATCGNAAGEAAGWCRTFATPAYIAVHKPVGQPVVDLNGKLPPQSPWLLTSANGINDAGAIAGEGVLNGFYEPFVMIPTQVAHAAPTPGVANTNNTIAATGATPGGTVWFFVAASGGQTVVPGCLEGLDLAGPVTLGTATANAAGSAGLTVFVPGSVIGIPLLFQAYDPAACHTSNVATWTF